MRIHISHEANKRTGKALGSVILLQHGYLPPLITKEYEKQYVDVLKYSFKNPNREEGFNSFLKFIIEMILRTQNLVKEEIS